MSPRPARTSGPCPLAAPDWCHFTQRLQRSRAHKQVKGAEVPFEDEKFAYVALTRAPLTAQFSRVLAQPPSIRSRSRRSFARLTASKSRQSRGGTRRPMREPDAGAGAMRSPLN